MRGVSGFRHAIGDPDFPAEPGRYHLFVALNCPWCHRVTLARGILGLRDSTTMDVAYPNRTGENDPEGPNLWEFNPYRVATLTGVPLPECTAETGTGHAHRLAKEIFRAEGSDEQSLPILYDKHAGRVVNNESAEILRMLNAAARSLASTLPDGDRRDLYPAHPDLWAEIDELNALIYTAINNGAYKAGFSSDRILGVVYARDILAVDEETPLRDLAREAPVVMDALGALEVIERLRAAPAHMLLVYDEYGGVEGPITPMDILSAIAGGFEVEDEPKVTRRHDGSVLVAGWMPIDEFAELMSLSLQPTPAYETVAGLVLQLAGDIPAQGEVYEAFGLRIEVVDMDGPRVDKLLVTRPDRTS